MVEINSRTARLWKLNTENGKIISFSKNAQVYDSLLDYDPIFEIITSTVACNSNGNLKWSKQYSVPNNITLDDDCDLPHISRATQNAEQAETLTCVPVNFTYYDELLGVANRYVHPIHPEPEVAYLFMKKKEYKYLKTFDVQLLERRLLKAKRNNPRSVQLYNQIGNFWRIKGDTKQAIECFRKALAITPTNSDVILNLARVLLHMTYLDDAMALAKRSLALQTPDRSAWRQYFTLGEIYKRFGNNPESIIHLKQALELHPNHELISKALREVEKGPPSTTLHICTVVIIVCLVTSVLFVIFSTNDIFANSSDVTEPKTHRHFNRAMAMRSLKGITSRSTKYKK
ncbi:Tetratricopeptide repeat protein 17, partial [Pseudolycoriella hygida]